MLCCFLLVLLEEVTDEVQFVEMLLRSVLEDAEVKTKMLEDDTTSKFHCFPERFLPPRVRLLFLA
jgi:hypothetical protein